MFIGEILTLTERDLQFKRLLLGLTHTLSHRKQTVRFRLTEVGRRCGSCVRWTVETSRAISPANLYMHHCAANDG